MHTKFDHKTIEEKWQKEWEGSGIYDVIERDQSKEKEYVLVELPYPSGNLHIGHWFAFAVSDIYVRAHRMQGRQVFFPMGFDAFGLPAENAAIKHGKDPKEWTESNILHMEKQLRSMGSAFTWNALHRTCDPEYYRWTQWMFTKFFEKDIAYRGTGIVNWCPSCNTVLANEQVTPDDTCERCSTEVEKKEMEEWKMRITKYADRLVDDLDDLDWPEHIKESQRQWIGRSEGAEIEFKLSTGDDLKVFTTRPDTLYGATYMVLAPEHDLLQKNKDSIENWSEVNDYIMASQKKGEQDRLDDTKEKTGVRLQGVSAVNPATGEEIPVYVADYVLMGYGTGAIMAVPAHDERDFAFAKKYALKIQKVVLPSVVQRRVMTLEDEAAGTQSDLALKPQEGDDELWTNDGTLINSGEFDGMDSEEAKKAITEKVGGVITNTYRLRDWSVGRQRYWGVPIPIVYDPEGKPHAVPEDHLPWLLPTDVDFRPTGEPPLAKSKELMERTEAIFGEGWTPAVETLDTFVDSSWYFLRYLEPHNDDEFASKRAQERWMPIDLYLGGAEHTTMHVLYSRFWQKALFDLDLVTVDEPYKRRINRGLVLGPDGNKMSKSKGNVIDPDEQVERLGADTVKMYLAFLGPYGEVTNYPWDTGGIAGLRRFLERVNGLREHIVDGEKLELTKRYHKTLMKVTEDIERLKFNTAISALMVFVTEGEKSGLSEETYKNFLRILAPFAPHLTEELWQERGGAESIHLEAWPEVDTTLAADSEVTIGVQINGKVRGSITVSPEASEEVVLEAARANAGLSGKFDGEISRIIYVPGKILNIIGNFTNP